MHASIQDRVIKRAFETLNHMHCTQTATAAPTRRPGPCDLELIVTFSLVPPTTQMVPQYIELIARYLNRSPEGMLKLDQPINSSVFVTSFLWFRI